MCPPRVKLWLTHLPNVLQNDASKSKPVGSLPAARPVVASPGFAQVSKNVGKTPQISDGDQMFTVQLFVCLAVDVSWWQGWILGLFSILNFSGYCMMEGEGGLCCSIGFKIVHALSWCRLYRKEVIIRFPIAYRQCFDFNNSVVQPPINIHVNLLLHSIFKYTAKHRLLLQAALLYLLLGLFYVMRTMHIELIENCADHIVGRHCHSLFWSCVYWFAAHAADGAIDPVGVCLKNLTQYNQERSNQF